MARLVDGPGPKYTLAERILIVPLAHTKVLDVHFQTEMYELFHRKTGSRLGHLIGTPLILGGLWMLTALLPLSIAFAAALYAYVVLWAFAVDRLVGVLAMIGGLALAALAFHVSNAVEADAAVVAPAVLFGGCAVQTFSHLLEDVPPPQSGTTHFVPMGAWIRSIGPREIARSTALTLAVFYWLELWAAPRVWPIQLLHMAMRAGYRPELRRRLDARVAAIVADPESSWRGRS